MTAIMAREIVRIAREISDRRVELDVLAIGMRSAVDAYDAALADEIVTSVSSMLPSSPSLLTCDRVFPLGGAPERVGAMVANALIALGWRVSVVAGDGDGGGLCVVTVGDGRSVACGSCPAMDDLSFSGLGTGPL
jgi:hypothetical protein